MSDNSNRQGSRHRRLVATAVVLLCLGGVAAFYLQDHLLPPRVVTAAEAGMIDGDTPFHDHVAQAGVTSCFGSFPAMGALLTQNSQYTVQSRWTEEQIGGRVIHAVVGMEFETPEYSGPAVGYVFAAPTGDRCAGGMVRVTPFAQSCDAVAQQFLPGSMLEAELQGLHAYAVADGSQVVIMPFGESCVVLSVGNMING